MAEKRKVLMKQISARLAARHSRRAVKALTYAAAALHKGGHEAAAADLRVLVDEEVAPRAAAIEDLGA